MEEMAKYTHNGPSTVAEVKAEVQLIQQILSEIMIKDVHYGTIPGTQKPTLYKPGSEKILRTFHIGVDPSEGVQDLSRNDEIRYRVYVKGFSQETGNVIGTGAGECSSGEEKYKWRRPVCDEEFNETPEDRKRIVWKKGNPNYKQKQVRTNPTDVANTVLKMAKKRSQIDMTLTATAASDVFDQDLEDMPDEIRDHITEHKAQKTTKASTVKPATVKKDESKKDEPKKSPLDTLKDELAVYCNGDIPKMGAILKDLTIFTGGEDGKEIFMSLADMNRAKETWIGKTLSKLRERVKAEGAEEGWCCGDKEACQLITFRGEIPWCEHEDKECSKG